MDIRKIRKLIELINETGIADIEVKSGEDSVRISKFSTSIPTAPPTPISPVIATPIEQPKSSTSAEGTAPSTAVDSIKSPMVGTAYLASSPGAKPFVHVGQRIAIGDTVCLIEAMKMFNKIEADKQGVIKACLIKDGEPVEYDQPLFIIDSDEPL